MPASPAPLGRSHACKLVIDGTRQPEGLEDGPLGMALVSGRAYRRLIAFDWDESPEVIDQTAPFFTAL